VLGGCDRPQFPDKAEAADPPSYSDAKAFRGEVYRSFNGNIAITLVSRDELELRDGNGPTILCKYTKQQNALRVVANAFGTTQVMYFQFTDRGVQTDDGEILLSRQHYEEALNQERLRQEQRQIEAQRREKEEARVASVRAESRLQTKVIKGFKLLPVRFSGGLKAVDSISVTDVAFHVHQPEDTFNDTNKTNIIDFADIASINEIEDDGGRFLFYIQFRRADRNRQIEIFTESKEGAETIRDTCMSAYNDWRRVFPDAVLNLQE